MFNGYTIPSALCSFYMGWILATICPILSGRPTLLMPLPAITITSCSKEGNEDHDASAVAGVGNSFLQKGAFGLFRQIGAMESIRAVELYRHGIMGDDGFNTPGQPLL